MSIHRFNAIDTILNRTVFDTEIERPFDKEKISDYFGENVFGDDAMRTFLSEEAYLSVKRSIETGDNLSLAVADQVAEAMKAWAIEKGATHYAHWFQPLTGRTAEKHDAFFKLDDNGRAIEEFAGQELAQQEPDGSSFPGGGLRSTFEARGYTAWDPSSPAFLLEVGDGKTLCIPTIFVTYSGDSLDYKLPLLKSHAYLEEAALKVMRFFDDSVKKVKTTLGWEQEYFLVDEALFNARIDLMLCGRTIIGKRASKGQQLDDHYFGTIPERVYSYMRDLEYECHRLGIPVRTRHNEVGPGQYELAPQYEEVNVAVDHNQLLMDLMDRIACRHKLRVLLHEKPFDGVNGSGKHNNWSMATDTGKNLLSPGDVPGRNLRFLTFFVTTIRAVYEYADLLRASVASAGNDHRLGANEAPPAIVSVFIGQALTEVLNNIEAGIEPNKEGVQQVLNLLAKIPNLAQDNTDRNRTSPFAFTGNKFEIRMVGSSQNCAAPMTIMNAIVGHQLNDFYDKVGHLTAEGMGLNAALLTVIKDYITESKVILFEGDNYSDEWKEEARRRGLNNFTETPDALRVYIQQKTIDLFEKTGIFSGREIHAHYEVMVENYIKKLQIESRTLGEICMSQVIPSAIKYQAHITANINDMMNVGFDHQLWQSQASIVERISENVNAIYELIKTMTGKRREANSCTAIHEVAEQYCRKVKPLMEQIRIHCDRLEYLVDDKTWDMVKYRELLFLR